MVVGGLPLRPGAKAPGRCACYDAEMTISEGGYQPDSGMKLPATVRVIKKIEPGLHLVSINEGAPEYLVAAEWVQKTSEAGELRLRFEALAAVWASRADHDEKFAQGVPEDVQDAMLDSVADWRQRADNIRAVLEEVPRSELVSGVRGVPAPDGAPPI